MTTALAPMPATAFGKDQIDLIKRTIAKGATDDELKLFLAQCERTGLDPFDRQIYFIKRKQKDKKTGQWIEVGQTQTSIDGFRVVAERTGEMDGQDVAWCDETGLWCDVWLKKTPPFAARVIAYRKGCSHGFPAIARFDEYAQTFQDGNLSGLWGKMPANQIAKCAEALALRKAFPKQLSGLYTREEMGQAENTSSYVVEAPSQPEAASQPSSEPKALEEPLPPLPIGVARIVKVQPKTRGAAGQITFSTGEVLVTYKVQLVSLAEQLCQDGEPVTWQTKKSASGNEYLVELHRVVAAPPAEDAPAEKPLTSAEIPF